MFTEGMTQVGSIRIHHKELGQGKPLLLLHGWGGQADSFAPVALAFADCRHVYSLDFPGFGESSVPETPWDVTDYMNCLAAWMQAQGLSHCDIIAHSFGCRVTILLAATHPELVGKLVLTGAAGLIPRRTLKYHLKVKSYKLMKKLAGCTGLTRLLKKLGIDLEEKVRSRSGSDDYRALPESMRGTFVRVVNQDLRGYLPSIQASTLLIFGDGDTATPPEFGRIMEKEIPDAGLIIFENAGHFAYLEKGADFARITRVFLEDNG